MPKACTITDKNQKALASKFLVDDADIPDLLPIGYILVTDFGNDETFETLTQVNFDRNYLKAGDLKNEFYEVIIR